MDMISKNIQLATKNCELKILHKEDLPFWLALRNNKDVAKYASYDLPILRSDGIKLIYSKIDQVKGKVMQNLSLIILLKKTQQHIGEALISIDSADNQQVQYSINIDPHFADQGFAKEVSTCIFNYLFKLENITKIRVLVDIKDTYSIDLMSQLGMKKEALFKENRLRNSCWHDEYYFGLLRKEWNF